MINMTEEEIERINRFIYLKNSPKHNKSKIKNMIFLIIASFMFFISDSLKRSYNLFTSWWMIFAVFACSIIIWGLFLLRNLDNRQIDFILYFGAVGTYVSTEFFALGISYGINDAHINVMLLVLLVLLLEVPLLLFLLWHRIQLFKGKKQFKGGAANYKIIIPLILIISPIIKMLFNNTQAQFQTIMMSLMFIFLGFVFSVSIGWFGNYYVARKYRSYIHLYENGIIQTGHNKEDGRSAHRNKK
jgi:hypothetical protein